jgi:zinc protease
MNVRSIARPVLWRGIQLACALTVMSLPAGAQSAAAPPQAQRASANSASRAERVTSVEGITEYRLANGLRVLLFPDPSKQTVTVNITYEVGSRHENYGETGMAHLLEHLMFKGSPGHPNIPQELSEHGARPNGTTWFDRTNYFETFASTDDNLKWALDLEADRMVHSFIAKKDLDSEMTVVRNEFEKDENEPMDVLLDRVMSTAYLWHNYGKSTIGSRSDIENVPIDRLQAFYRMYYQPDNAVLLIAGKFDEAKTLDLVSQSFGAIPRPTRRLPEFYTSEPTQDGERNLTLRRSGEVQFAAAGYHVPAGSHPDFAAVELLVHILGDAPGGRLHKALVDTKKATRVFGRDYMLHDPSVVLFVAEVRQESPLEEARDTLLAATEDLLKNPPTKDEIERARTRLLTQMELALNSSDRVGLRLSEWIGMGDWRLLFLHRDRLRQVTSDDVQRVAGRYLKASNRTVGLFIPTPNPDRSEIPPVPNLAEMLKDYKGDAVVSAGEAFDPSPANVDARTIRSSLPSGLKLALVPKKTRGRRVVASLTLRFGDEKSLVDRSTAAQLAGGMLMRGTTKHTRQQIQDEFDRLGARVFVGGAVANASATVETSRENLPAVLRLVAEVLRDPAFPPSEFEQLKQQRLAGLEQQRSDPQAIGSVALQRHLRPYPKGDVRYVQTLDEAIAELRAATVGDARTFYADFYGASNGELAVVGDFDAQEIASLTTELFSDWKAARPYARITETFKDVPASDEALQTPDKANAFFVAGTNLDIRDDDPDYPALVLGNYMLGGGFLNSRLATRIRQKEGISYGIGSQLQASSIDRNGAFIVRAIYAPENAARLQSAFKDEIARALKDGFASDEVKAAQAGWLQSRQVGRAQDAELASRLTTLSYLNRTVAWDAQLEQRIEALTPAEVQAALVRHIDPSRFSIVKAGDFAKSASRPAGDVR